MESRRLPFLACFHLGESKLGPNWKTETARKSSRYERLGRRRVAREDGRQRYPPHSNDRLGIRRERCGCCTETDLAARGKSHPGHRRPFHASSSYTKLSESLGFASVSLPRSDVKCRAAALGALSPRAARHGLPIGSPPTACPGEDPIRRAGSRSGPAGWPATLAATVHRILCR